MFIGEGLLSLHCHGGFFILSLFWISSSFKLMHRLTPKRDSLHCVCGSNKSKILATKRLCHCATTALCTQNDNGARSSTDTELFPTSEQIERKPTASFEKALIKICLLPHAVLSAHRVRLIKRLQSSVSARTHLPLLDEGT